MERANRFAEQRVSMVAKLQKPVRNQDGIALILAISMLAIMSVLGMMALSTTDTELNLSGNFRTSQMAFFSAQRAVEYAMTDGDIFNDIGAGSISLGNDPHKTNIAAGTGFGIDTDATNTVTYQMTGMLPPGSGSDPTYFESRYYLIDVTGQGPNNSEARVETQIGRIVPK